MMDNCDIKLTRRVHDMGSSTPATWYILSVYAMWGFIAYFLFIWSFWDFSFGILTKFLFAILVTFIVTVILRIIIRRPRPKLFNTNYVPWMNRFTFPSIHASTSGAFATSLVLLSPSSFTGGVIIIVGIFAFGLALGIAISRIMVGVHYVADIFAGLLLGIAVSAMVIGV